MAPYRSSLLNCVTVMEECGFESHRGFHGRERTSGESTGLLNLRRLRPASVRIRPLPPYARNHDEEEGRVSQYAAMLRMPRLQQHSCVRAGRRQVALQGVLF